MKYPFVSVVVVVYNGERYIKDCLLSLLDLNYPKNKYEIIVIDGGSTDGTLNITKRYPVKFFLNKKRIIAPGRNLGVKKSKGEYIAFTDSDCEVDKNWLINLVNVIKKSEENVVGVGGPNLIFKNDPKLAKIIGYMQETLLGSGGSPQSYKINELKEVYSIANCNAIYKKEILEKFRYNESINIGEDCEINFRITKNGFKLLYTNKPIVWHHRRSTIRALIKNMFKYGEAQAKISKLYKKLVRKYSILPPIFVISLVLATPLIVLSKMFLWAYLVIFSVYFILLLLSTFYVIKKIKFIGLLTILLLPIQHVSYGIGFLWGVIDEI